MMFALGNVWFEELCQQCGKYDVLPICTKLESGLGVWLGEL